MGRHYILDGHRPVPCDDFMAWGTFMDKVDGRRVGETSVGDIWVSTVFLGLDHRYGNGPPMLFETMAFIDDESLSCDRYSTWEQAETGHALVVQAAHQQMTLVSLAATLMIETIASRSAT